MIRIILTNTNEAGRCKACNEPAPFTKSPVLAIECQRDGSKSIHSLILCAACLSDLAVAIRDMMTPVVLDVAE